jgi:hypothetical protein
MSDLSKKHPYLEDQEDVSSQQRVLRNTNAGFPVRVLLDKGVHEIPPATQRKKLKKKSSRAQVKPRKEQEAEMLTPFTQWLLSLKPAPFAGTETATEHETIEAVTRQEFKEELIEPEKKKKKKKKKKKEVSRKEIREDKSGALIRPIDKGIVSDTLAELIAGQGHLDEAIQMYRKLIDLHPEKAPYYLQKITELRQGKS